MATKKSTSKNTKKSTPKPTNNYTFVEGDGFLNKPKNYKNTSGLTWDQKKANTYFIEKGRKKK